MLVLNVQSGESVLIGDSLELFIEQKGGSALLKTKMCCREGLMLNEGDRLGLIILRLAPNSVNVGITVPAHIRIQQMFG